MLALVIFEIFQCVVEHAIKITKIYIIYFKTSSLNFIQIHLHFCALIFSFETTCHFP